MHKLLIQLLHVVQYSKHGNDDVDDDDDDD